ncbi:MAG: ATPase domain-containing protein [Candidatus Spyradenecus sp.]
MTERVPRRISRGPLSSVIRLLSFLRSWYRAHAVAPIPPSPPPSAPCQPTGFRRFDALLEGGLPCGRAVEILAPPGRGKTTLALRLAAAFQQQGLRVVLLAADGTLTPAYAKAQGLALDCVLWIDPALGERALAVAQRLLLEGVAELLVLDAPDALGLPRHAFRALGRALATSQALCLLTRPRGLFTPAPLLQKALRLYLHPKAVEASNGRRALRRFVRP